MTEQIKKCKDCVNYDETKVRQCICYNNECKPNEDATHCCEFADMVYRINRAIDWFDDFVGFYSLSEDEKKMFYFAIRSLKAWEEVLYELETKQKSIHDCALDHEDDFYLGEVIGIVSAIEVINQHLAEIK